MRKILLFLAGTVILSGCEKTFDVTSLQEEIKTSLNQQNGISVKSVHCPTNIKIQPENTFECTGELNPDGGFFVTVQQENEGKAKWEIPNSWRLLNLTKLEAEFQEKIKATPQNGLRVTCGGSYRVIKPGDSFECQLTRKDKTDAILVKIEPEGQVNWQEVRTVTVPEKATSALPSPAAIPDTTTTAATVSSLPSESKSAVPPGAQIKDETGWQELND